MKELETVIGALQQISVGFVVAAAITSLLYIAQRRRKVPRDEARLNGQITFSVITCVWIAAVLLW
ncbi:hypothetical protein MXC99_10715 [Thauera aromatica]|uniref:hypothetical protein n=1 Tax=Thauera aromatica TaxID=59405 RepID=UPI001FFC82F3|nr:hypothetical protein [Thauera aromatica]MCK2088642.1 hypothetical protein [Thauera aromatica]